MKSFEYYRSKVSIPSWLDHKNQLIADINNTRLTSHEREKRMGEIPQLMNSWYQDACKIHKEDQNKLDQEFYQDASEELGYNKFGDQITSIIEYAAYEDGHSSGYSEIYHYLIKYTEFANQIINAFLDNFDDKSRKKESK